MRVLFCVSAWPTHYMAMIPTAWALTSAGHEVRMLCAPSQVEPIGRAGLVPVPLLDGMSMAVHNRLQYYREAVDGDWPYPWLPLHPITGAGLRRLSDFDLADYERRVAPRFAELSARSCDAAVRFARDWHPDLVLHDPMSVEGMLVAEVRQIPAALFMWGPVGTDEPAALRLLPADLGGSYPRHGVPELDPKLVRYVVDPCPAPLAPPTQATRLPVRYVPYNGGGVLPSWLLKSARRPRVCVSWSTALSRMSGPDSYLLPLLVRTLGTAAEVELVVTATREDLAALGPPPPSVRLLEHCPLQLLLPSCSVVVHHGGAGSTMTALAAGVPQLVITFATEQAANGRRVAATGAGLTLPGHLATPDNVRTAVRRLMADPTFLAQARALRADLIARPSPLALVGTLVALADGRH